MPTFIPHNAVQLKSSGQAAQRLWRNTFKAFVLFVFQRDLTPTVFTGLDPFQTAVLIMLFISAATTSLFKKKCHQNPRTAVSLG